jgi:glycerate dehydrogenase
MHHIVFLDRAILPIDLPQPSFAHSWAEYPVTAPGELDARLQGATIVISSKIPLRGETLARFPNIRFIAVAGTGVDVFDLDYCREHGVPVSNVRGYAEHTVPEHAFMLILALARNLPGYRSDVETGQWQRAQPFCLLTRPIFDLHGKTLGIVGDG